MFSGQGAQYYHMGAQLYALNKFFRQHMEAVDSTVMTQLGCSVLASMYAPQRRKTECFDHTVLSSLAIFMVERALTETLAHYDCRPDAVLSVSMGAFAAICAGGAVGHQDMLEALLQQSDALESACLEGAMLAILAPLAVYEHNLELAETSEVAAVNAASHFVIASLRTEIPRVEAFLATRKVAFQRLPVSRAYHSRWIDPARAGFFGASKRLLYTQGRIPMNLCSTAPSAMFPSTEAIWNAIRAPIRFSEAVQHFEQDGPHRYIDVGTSGTLATLLKYALPVHSRSCAHAILTPLGHDHQNLQKVLLAVGACR